MLGKQKTFGLLHRRAGTSIAAFQKHWRTTHANEALKLTPYLSRYAQNHFDEHPLPGLLRPCDGSPVVWANRDNAFAEMSTSDEYMTGAYVDEPNFMEGRSVGFGAQEEIVMPGQTMIPTPRTVKVLLYLKRAAGLSLKEFQNQWRAAGPTPLLLSAPNAMRYIRSFALANPADPGADPIFDGAEELWWTDEKDYETDSQAWAATEMGRDLLDSKKSAGGRVEERRVIWPTYTLA
jgi:hypothetical protein